MTDFVSLEEAMAGAVAAAPQWRGEGTRERAAALRQVADPLDETADELVAVAASETRLGEARLRGELARTTFQLRFLGDVIERGDHLQAWIDPADEKWPVGPRPDVRRVLRPIGPVAVFAAGNFPFAFSVAGGDTASALAAGCPVVLKAHPGHLRLSALCGEIVSSALQAAGAPAGTFSMVEGDETGRELVVHPRTAAVAFTGSQKVGRLLFDLAVGRPDPIPFYGELGSINPVFVTRRAALARGDEILAGYAASISLGGGQFCTQPGVILVPDTGLRLDALGDLVAAQGSARLLNDRIERGFESGLSRLRAHRDLEVLVEGRRQEDGSWSPTVLRTSLEQLLRDPEQLLQECFGPVSIVAVYRDEADLLSAARSLEGQLTATVHGEADDAVAPQLVEELSERVGRIVWNGWPTGVSVTWAMQHGGPYPATTAPLHTSVGAAAVARFLRPVAYQGLPDRLLPASLRRDNPLGLPRVVAGRYQAPEGTGSSGP